MLMLANTTDKLQLTTGAAVTVDVLVSYSDVVKASGVIVAAGDRQPTAISTATTTDILSAPGSNNVRKVKSMTIRNKATSGSVDVTVIYDANGTDYELHKATLAPGECLEYIEGVGFFVLGSNTKLDQRLVVTADVTNATTSFADVTDLTIAIKSGKTYCFDCCLLFQTNATTTGARFGVNGPASPTYLRLAGIGVVTVSATAGVVSTNTATVSAYDTSAIGAQTTGPGTVDCAAYMFGTIVPSADGTFAVRSQSEVAVASGLIVRRGSYLRIWEPSNV